MKSTFSVSRGAAVRAHAAVRPMLWLTVFLATVSAGLAGANPSLSKAEPAFVLVEYQQPTGAPERTGAASSPDAGGIRPSALNGGFDGPQEVEPNGSSATATPLGGSNVQLTGSVFPPNDVDFYSFAAAAGDRVYAATQTLWDASASGDSVLDVLNTDGTTVIETDNNDGTFNASSSTVAGTLIPAAGTYFLRVRHNVATGTIRPYALHFRLQSAAPVAEVEPNNTPATATPIPASGHVTGTISAVSPGESDFYSLNLNAGDTVFLSLDMNPERDAAVWNGRLGFGLFGNPPVNQILLANDANAGASAADPNSEAFFFTVKDTGSYFVYIDSIVAAGLGAAATYNLNVSVRPQYVPPGTCTTYTSTDVPVAIPTVAGMVTSTVTVPGNPRIEDLDVQINLNHTFMQDLDVHLVSPAGNDNGLFTDIGAATVGGAQTLMDIVLDDEAGLPPAFAMSASFRIQPELAYRLNWFDGEDAGGTWTLALRDDAAGDGGTLNGWSLRICEPPPPPVCPAGHVEEIVYSTDFETDDAGFTHAGAQDEWERGLPTFIPITTCASGVNCFKTDLDNSYNASSSQDLLSPSIDLSGHVAPVRVRWAQRYHIESANFDHYFVDAQEVGGANPLRLFEWLGATMNNTVGNPTVTIAESSGWAIMEGRADALAGLNAELRYHLDSDTTVQLAGVGVDDVSVSACRLLSADLAITKTDGVATAVPGGSVTYTITASNAGADAVTGATVADTFPASLSCTWTCVGAGGGTCTAAGAGDINDLVDLPVGGSATYTASCAVSASATGTLMNTATVSSTVTDPNPANNSATDTDSLTPEADIAITKTDGVASAVPGGSVTYTITASNAGPSDAPGATVADTFPAPLTCTWTCVGAGGGTCTAAGAGNINDTVNLPAGGSTTYTASCTIAASASGVLSNTATAAPPPGVTDPNPANNSATDTDTLTPEADLSITKTDGVTDVNAGGSTTYTIVASNTGPSDALAATVADTFPAALTCTWTCVGAGGGGCAAAGAGNINDSVDLPAGASVTYTAMCSISGAATGTLDNTATITPGAATDPVPGNNSATDSDTIIPLGALVSATKTVSGTFTPAGSITYSVILSNGSGAQGDNPGDEFSDVLPAQLALVSATASSGTAVATIGTNTVAWNGAIPMGGNVTISIDATILPSASGTISNQGSVSYDADGNGTNESTGVTDDPGTGAANDPTSFIVGVGSADLSITKTDGVSNVTPGGSTTYTIVASNAGPADANGATVNDTFPAACTATWSCVGAGGTCAANGSGDIADSVNLPAGASVTYTATCAIAGAATGTLVNTASVVAPGSVNDPDGGNNSATDTDTVDASADLAITLGDTPDPVTAGGTLTYQAAITNNGPSAADSVAVSLPLPADTTFVSAAPGAGGVCTTPAVGANGTVSCTWAGATASGAMRSAAIVVQVAASAVGPLSATATASSTTNDATPANNTATATTTVGSAIADLSLGLTAAPASVDVDGTVTLTATGSNAGPDPAQDVQITIVLGPNLRFASVAPGAGGTCTTPAVGATGTVVCTYTGPTASGATRTVVVTATAPDAGTASVDASIASATTDPTPANAQANALVQIGGSGSFVEPILIPALDRGVLILLGLMLGLIGFATVRRQS